MDKTAKAEAPGRGEHTHYWQLAPYEWEERKVGGGVKRIFLVQMLRHCVLCGEAEVITPVSTPGQPG